MIEPYGKNWRTTLVKIASLQQLPEDVANTPMLDPEAAESLCSTSFAHPADRMYPIHKRSSTWLSRKYFEADRVNFPKHTQEFIDKNLERAEQFWGIDKVAAMEGVSESDRSNIPYMVKTASVQHKVQAKNKDEVVFSAVVETPEQVTKLASQLFTKHIDQPFAVRSSLAQSLLDLPEDMLSKLASSDVEHLEKLAGRGIGFTDMGKSMLNERCALLRKTCPEAACELGKVAMALPANELFKISSALEFVNLLDTVDGSLNLKQYYSRGLTLPEEAIGILPKHAAEMQKGVHLSNEVLFSRNTILSKKAAITDWVDQYFGDIPWKNDTDMYKFLSEMEPNVAEEFCRLF